MTSRTQPHLPDETRARVRRLLVQSYLRSANAALAQGACPDDVGAALLACAIDLNLDVVPAEELARELRRLADEVGQLPGQKRQH